MPENIGRKTPIPEKDYVAYSGKTKKDTKKGYSSVAFTAEHILTMK